MLLQELVESKKDKEKKNKIVFVEFDPQQPFPDTVVLALEKTITKNARDLEKKWKSPIELTNFAFDDLKVPIPLSYLKNRWQQYVQLLTRAVNALKDARGFSDWTTT